MLDETFVERVSEEPAELVDVRVRVVLLSGHVQELCCRKMDTVSELRRKVSQKLGLTEGKACKLLDPQGTCLPDDWLAEELHDAVLTGVLVRVARFRLSPPDDFGSLCVEGFGDMSAKYMEIKNGGQMAMNRDQQDGRAELEDAFSDGDLPVQLLVSMPASSGYAHFIYVRRGSNVATVEANKEDLYSVTLDSQNMTVEVGQGADRKTCVKLPKGGCSYRSVRYDWAFMFTKPVRLP
ncbi:hypothetical protein AK812_SmicGene20592 [Symbiodinium microadriaticum]|uniref:Ubiquitin-like domain-containing protein n=1 Tax=Symbiodinium microadriaticum TaxID=2951 RepID=A0A1Q9DPL0_SYMMI|nr:hypothetical protein AK812_SmicGene20592 [Symbiodinium microadriaticum]